MRRDRKEYNRLYYLTHQDKLKQYAHNYYKSNYSRLKEYWNELRRKKYQEAKIVALTHYGNGKLACARCGFNDIRALSIDHIDGRGNYHRKFSHVAARIYQWLIQNNFPDGFQTLCMNCQLIKKVERREYGGENT